MQVEWTQSNNYNTLGEEGKLDTQKDHIVIDVEMRMTFQ